MTTVTEQINEAITEAGGNVRDALNDALAGRDAAVALLAVETERSIALLEALETIRALTRLHGKPPAGGAMMTIDVIAREVLKISGEIAMHTEATE